MTMPAKCSTRSGNALVLTMIVVTGLASLLALSSQRVQGMNQLAGFNLRNQQACYAAEAGASIVEGCVYAASGNNQALTTDIQDTSSGVQSTTTWLSYMGYVGSTGQQSATYAAGGLPNLWIGNCLVQWRLEPVTVYAQTYQCNTLAPYEPATSGTGVNSYAPPTASSSNQFLYNYQANPSLQGTAPSNSLTNPGFYHYRIVATAYYMQDLGTLTAQFTNSNPNGATLPVTIANATPWKIPGESMAVAQVERYVEIKLVNLFQYVIFYAAVGPTGDIEFHPGPALTITGAVQSNGSIYMGGANTPYTTGSYHDAADEGGQVNIGTSSSPVAVTGVGGIFRMRKASNYWFAMTNPSAASVLNPMNVPTSGNSIGGIAMSGENDLNGDDTGNTLIQLNGYSGTNNALYAGTKTNDSRGGLTVAGTGGYIKDSNHGATIVQTLSNFPQLAGYPFEYQQIVPPAVNSSPEPIYSSGSPYYYLTINPTRYPNSTPVYYSTTYGSFLTTTAPANPTPVYATDLPLYWFQSPSTGAWFTDIWPAQPTQHTSSTLTNPGSPNSYTAGNQWPYINVNNGNVALGWGIGKGFWNTGYIPNIAGTVSGPYTASIFDTYLPYSSPTPAYSACVEGYFLNESMRGLKGSGKTGLTIRERGTPNLSFKWYRWNSGDTLVTGPTGTLTMAQLPWNGSSLITNANPGTFPYLWNQCDSNSAAAVTLTLNPAQTPVGNAEMVSAYVAMLEASYAVYLGVAPAYYGGLSQPYDITASFFNYSTANAMAVGGLVLNAAAPANGLIATQDFFMNWREASWMQVNHYLNASQAPKYYVDALTLNVGLICSYLQSTAWNSIDPSGVTGNTGLLNSNFNGIIYVQRTPRAADWATLPTMYSSWGAGMQVTGQGGLPYPNYDPLSPLGFNPLFSTNVAGGGVLSPYIGPFASATEGGAGGANASYPVVGNATLGTEGTMNSMCPGQANVWSVYPSPKAVRLFNGASINWGGVQPAAANRPQGLTVITPDPCYMWGNYNTQTFNDANGVAQITPCAVYCDELTDLSAGWVDNVNNYSAGDPNTTVNTSYVCSVVINNLPTDNENSYCGGSNGTHNVIRYAENWSASWTFEGSLVVLNRMRYTRGYQTTPTPTIDTVCPLSANGSFYAGNTSGGYYSPPTRIYKFNNDLLSSFGQPPASLSGISVQRVVSTVNIINK